MCGPVRANDVCDVNARRASRASRSGSGSRGTRGSFCVTLAVAARARAGGVRAARAIRRRCGRRASTRRSGKTFPTLAAARSWRHESQVALRKGMLRSSSHLTLERGGEGVARRSRGGHRPDAHRRGVQALRRSAPTGRRSTTASSQPRREAADRDQPHDAAGLRRPALRPGALGKQRPQHDPALAGDLPARPPPQRRRRQPDAQAHPPRRAQPERTRRSTNRGRPAPRRPPSRRPSDLRHRPLRRTPARRAASPAMGRHRPQRQPDPRQTQLGPPSRLRRTQEPLRQPPRPDHPHPPPRTPQATASNKAKAAKASSSPTNAETSRSTPAPSNSTPPKPGPPPGSPRSASTNADTATPPT